jgi:RNA polymerase primary sigma factor
MMFYLTQINKVPLLTREEEFNTAVQAKNGDKAAKKKLIAANLRFVVQTAKRYSNCGIPFIDLVSEGNLGLIRAVDSFNPHKGYHFISYAVHWIKQSIIKAISEKSKIVRIPLNLNNSISHIEKSIQENGEKEINDTWLKKISNETNIAQKDILNLMDVMRSHSSLDKTINDETGQRQLKDIVSDEARMTPEESAINNSLQKELEKVLSDLTDQEAEIITLRFGLHNKKPMTLLQIGKLMGLTKERIRQIEKKALDKLKSPEYTSRLQEYITA